MTSSNYKRGRRERALEIRKRDLRRLRTGQVDGLDEAQLESKINKAEAEIATLEKRLGVIKGVPIVDNK